MEIEEEKIVTTSDLSLNQRVQALYEAGMTSAAQIHRRVTRKVHVGERTIERKVSILKQGNSLDFHQRKQRNDKFLTEEIKEEIEEYLEQNPYSTAQMIIDDLDYDVSTRTMQRAMKECEFTYKPTTTEPMIKADQKIDRIHFANLHLHRDWENVVFVDECTFIAYQFPRMAYQKKGQKVRHARPKHPVKIHGFAGITVRGKTTLHLFRENLTGPMYKEMLRTKLLPSIKRLYNDETWILAQDNDPKHTSRVVQTFIEEKDIELLEDWPSSSPDLNPIENIWGIMKEDIRASIPKSLTELEIAVRRSWRDISMECIVNCIESMPRRLRLVIDSFGNKIPY